MNQRQAERLKRLADWLHEHDRKFLFELLVPAEAHQLEQVGGDADRYDAELRPELMRRTIVEFQDAGHRGGHLEDRGDRHPGGLRADRADRPARRARRRHLRGARPRRQRREGRPLAAPGRSGGGLRRLRDRPHDLVGRAQGLPRRRPRARGRRAADGRATTCASCRSTRRRRGSAPPHERIATSACEAGSADSPLVAFRRACA